MYSKRTSWESGGMGARAGKDQESTLQFINDVRNVHIFFKNRFCVKVELSPAELYIKCVLFYAMMLKGNN